MRRVRFDHRDTEGDPSVIDRVWHTRSAAAETMISAARTCSQLVFTRTQGRLRVDLRGPETRATSAPVPPDAEFLGIRFSLGSALRPHPVHSIVDGYVSFPVTDLGRVVIGGQDWEAPTYANVEYFVERLQEAGLLVRSRLEGEQHVAPHRGGRPSRRTLQRRHHALTGLSPTAVQQIDRANAAATMLRDGLEWGPVVDALGFFDQAHLSHALRRYVGRTAEGLRTDDRSAMSFLYKTGSAPGS